jgi:hypothetical protein
MKLLLAAVAALTLVCFNPSLRAQDDPKRAAAAEELLKVMHTDELMAKQKEAMQKMMAGFLPKTLTPDQLKKAQDAQAVALDAIFKELTWESLKPDFVEIYSEVFTTEELTQLTEFYKTPIGQKLIEKMPELQAKSMQIMQTRMKTLLPAIQKAMQDAAAKTSGDQELPPPSNP